MTRTDADAPMARNRGPMRPDVLRRFHAALPRVREWIDELLRGHADAARSVGSLGFARLRSCFPEALLERARVVTLPQVPVPPVASFGLPELAGTFDRTFAGITFRDTYFLLPGEESESLHFHELIHVVQWERLGVDRFLLAYGAGLLEFGYERSPLERMAYELQRDFDDGATPPDLVGEVVRQADAVWECVAPRVAPAGGGA